MVEQNRGEHRQTSGEMKQDLLLYLKDADFGTPRYLAFCDYYDLHRQYESLGIVRKNSVSADNDAEGQGYWQSKVRIGEMQIALLEREIERNKSRIRGYGVAMAHIYLSFEDLGPAVYEEAKRENPNKEDEFIDRVVSDKRAEILGELREELFKREN